MPTPQDLALKSVTEWASQRLHDWSILDIRECFSVKLSGCLSPLEDDAVAQADMERAIGPEFFSTPYQVEIFIKDGEIVHISWENIQFS